jgi:hypothetical protein
MTQHPGNPVKVKNDEIDMLEVFRTLWSGRKTILLSMVVFVVAGGSYFTYKAKTTPGEFQTKATFLVETSLTTPGTVTVIQERSGWPEQESRMMKIPNPELVPVILKSTPFLSKLSMVNITDPASGSVMSIMEYLEKHTNPPQGNLSSLAGRISAVPGIASTVELSVTMQDPDVARQMIDSVPDCIETYFQDRLVKKLKNRINVLEKRYSEAEYNIRKAHKNLTIQEKSVTRAEAADEKDRLKTDYVRALRMFNDLALQLEQAKILADERPEIFTVIEPPAVVSRINKPDIPKKLMLMLILGGIAGAGIHWLMGQFRNKTNLPNQS